MINARLLIAGRRRDSPVGLDLSSGFLQSGVEIASISIGQSSCILDRYIIVVETGRVGVTSPEDYYFYLENLKDV